MIPCSFVNGEGARYVVFLQGCAHHCYNCQNPDTWDFNGGYEITVEELAELIRRDLERHPLDGITLSGGDPMYQQEECMKLLDLFPGVNVWIYTGFEWEDICDFDLAKRVDAVVTGEFVESLKCEGKYYGSSNQKIIRNERNES